MRIRIKADNEFMHLDVFPFVILHAFGEESFKLWLLPQPDKRTFGFLHTFAPKNMVFMRGDFVHAGCVGQNPRGQKRQDGFVHEASGTKNTRGHHPPFYFFNLLSLSLSPMHPQLLLFQGM